MTDNKSALCNLAEVFGMSPAATGDDIDTLREAYVAAGYVVGSTVEAERECAYCGEPIGHGGDWDKKVTCGLALCENEYWNETNAENLQGG